VVQADQSRPPAEILNATRAEYRHDRVSSQACTHGCAATLICHGPRFTPLRAVSVQWDSYRAMQTAVRQRLLKTSLEIRVAV
jgi:hypothetical protein